MIWRPTLSYGYQPYVSSRLCPAACVCSAPMLCERRARGTDGNAGAVVASEPAAVASRLLGDGPGEEPARESESSSKLALLERLISDLAKGSVVISGNQWQALLERLISDLAKGPLLARAIIGAPEGVDESQKRLGFDERLVVARSLSAARCHVFSEL